MRNIGLLLVLLAAFSSAQNRIMHFFLKDGTIDSIYCSHVDTAVGITFGKTKFSVGVVDTVNGSPQRSVLGFCTGEIDSITFDFIGGAPYKFTKSPAPNQVYHIGDTIPLQWQMNPSCAGEKAFFEMSIDGGAHWNNLTNRTCYMMYRDSGAVGDDTLCTGITYWPWPYVRTGGVLVGTWRLTITNPMVKPDVAPQFNPISDAVMVRIKDFDIDDIEHVSKTSLFSIKP